MIDECKCCYFAYRDCLTFCFECDKISEQTLACLQHLCSRAKNLTERCLSYVQLLSSLSHKRPQIRIRINRLLRPKRRTRSRHKKFSIVSQWRMKNDKMQECSRLIQSLDKFELQLDFATL